ncbi:hypothetical protein KBZ10_01395 [Streptomyces sp. F63]|uniref:hypothetical protein n=1 Tax=Streptomyces sp. F63 TaxID=2824887 RepID=UPI001B3589C7|nr:hypothetical protein [Streptomyces sp. F63]MBQ0983215.1 hypothetical protein [Streptomyces sp. F63]
MTDRVQAAPARPVFDPELSLGWRTGPLDGLSCLLRCAESVLRAEGFGPLDVARALALPLDLSGARRAPGRFRSGRLQWRNAVDGREHWAELERLVADGTPVVLMPDRFYWPGDEFEGKRHFLDHMVLVIGRAGSRLTALDTDAPAEDGYLRHIEITPEVRRGACRFATVHFDAPGDTAESLRTTLLEPMARWTADDLAALDGFAARWEREGLNGPMARALHVLVLGELQPALFLTSLSVQDTAPAVADASRSAAAAAQRLGMALLGAHRFAGEQAEDSSFYGPVLPAFDSVRTALARLVSTAHAELGLVQDPPGRPDDRLWHRVERMRDWCFADAVAPPTTVTSEGDNR